MNENVIKKNTKKRFFKNNIILFLSSAFLIAGIIFAINLFDNYYEENKEIKIELNDIYQYYSGIKKEYNIATLIKEEDKNTLYCDNYKVEIDTLPIYYSNINNEAFFPSEMQLLIPRIENRSYSIKYFNKIVVDIVDDNETAAINNSTKTKYLETSFLYDGDDLYFFPYSTKLVIKEKEYNLSALSYVIVNYGSSVEVYDKVNDKYTMIDNVNGDVIAYVGDYKVNLSTDMIIYNNSNRLLKKSTKGLTNYFEIN